MNEPSRLMSSSIDPEVRRWLEVGSQWTPASGEKERIWQALAAEASVIASGAAIAVAASETSRIAPTAGKLSNLGTLAATSGAKVSLALVALKAVSVGIGIGTALLVGSGVVKSHWIEHRASTPTATIPTVAPRVAHTAPPGGSTAAPRTDSLAREDAVTPIRAVAAASAPARTTAQAKSSAPAVASAREPLENRNALREESRFVSMARSALRQGRTAEALQLLDELDQLHPSGLLSEERTVLRIETLVNRGQANQALELAGKFLTRYPASLSAKHVRELVSAAQ